MISLSDSRSTTVTKLRMAVQTQKIGRLAVVKGHSRSWAMSPFGRAYTTSYSTIIETMRLSWTVDSEEEKVPGG